MDKKQRTSRRSGKSGSGGLKTLLAQHQSMAVDSLLRLMTEPLGTFLTWAVMGIALALPLTLLILLQNLQDLGAGLEGSSTVSVFLERGMSPVQQEELLELIASRIDVEQADLISAEASLEEFRVTSGLGEVLDGLDENPLPAVLEIMPAQTAPGAVTALVASLETLSGIDSVVIDLLWLQRLEAIVNLAIRLAVLLAGMLSVGVLLVIGNTIRLAIENRRAEIVVVKLVGGTDAYVARPFLYTGLWYGIGGGLLAVLIVNVAIWGLRGPYASLLAAYAGETTLNALTVSSAFVVLIATGMLGLVGAVISVYRHLRHIEPG